MTFAVVQIPTSGVRFPTGRTSVLRMTLSAKSRPCIRFNSEFGACVLRLTGAPRRPLVAGKRKLEFAKWKGSHGTQLSGVDLGVKVWGL